MTTYTIWTPYAYNGITIYLTDAPANVRYIDPDHAPEFVEAAAPLPYLPHVNDGYTSKAPRCNLIITWLRKHGEGTTIDIADGTDGNRRATETALIINPERFVRTGEVRYQLAKHCPVWRLK